MRKTLLICASLLVLIVIGILLDPNRSLLGRLQGEPFFGGRPASYWSKALLNDDPRVKETARVQLTAEDGSSVAVLARILDQPHESSWATSDLRCQAAEILGEIGPAAQSVIPIMLERMHDDDPHVRSVAALALPAIGTSAEQAVPALIDLLKREPSVVVARALSEYGPGASPAIDPLVEILSDKGQDTEIRWNAARTLGKIREPAVVAVPTLIIHVTDEAPTVREHSAEALGDIGPLAKDGVPALIDALDDPAPRVRRDSARSLGQIGPSAATAVEPLKVLLDDPEQIVRDAARTALQILAPGVR